MKQDRITTLLYVPVYAQWIPQFMPSNDGWVANITYTFHDNLLASIPCNPVMTGNFPLIPRTVHFTNLGQYTIYMTMGPRQMPLNPGMDVYQNISPTTPQILLRASQRDAVLFCELFASEQNIAMAPATLQQLRSPQ